MSAATVLQALGQIEEAIGTLRSQLGDAINAAGVESHPQAQLTAPRDVHPLDDIVDYNPAAHLLVVGGSPLRVTPIEWDLFRAFYEQPFRVFTKTDLLMEVWDLKPHQAKWKSPRTVDSHVVRLRVKLREADPSVAWLSTIWGVGYRLLTPAGVTR